MGQQALLAERLEPFWKVHTLEKAWLKELAADGLERRVRERHARYQHGEISFGRLAEELGFNVWELTQVLDEMDLPTTNLPG
jgi:hypothetical protein